MSDASLASSAGSPAGTCSTAAAGGAAAPEADSPLDGPVGRMARIAASLGLLGRLLADCAGATAIEYGLIAVLVTVGAVTLLGGTGQENVAALNSIDTALAGNDSPWAPDHPPVVAAPPPPPPQPWWAPSDGDGGGVQPGGGGMVGGGLSGGGPGGLGNIGPEPS